MLETEGPNTKPAEPATDHPAPPEPNGADHPAPPAPNGADEVLLAPEHLHLDVAGSGSETQAEFVARNIAWLAARHPELNAMMFLRDAGCFKWHADALVLDTSARWADTDYRIVLFRGAGALTNVGPDDGARWGWAGRAAREPDGAVVTFAPQ